MKYRKKPVEVEAVEWDGTQDAFDKLTDFHEGILWSMKATALYIDTLEGVMRADVGDYIIKGVEGEVYPCKPSVFRKTYDTVHTKPPPPPALPGEWVTIEAHRLYQAASALETGEFIIDLRGGIRLRLDNANETLLVTCHFPEDEEECHE